MCTKLVSLFFYTNTVFFFLTISANAQQELTTLAGQNIRLYSDFSWEIITNSSSTPYKSPEDHNTLPNSSLVKYLSEKEIKTYLDIFRQQNNNTSIPLKDTLYQQIVNDYTSLVNTDPNSKEWDLLESKLSVKYGLKTSNQIDNKRVTYYLPNIQNKPKPLPCNLTQQKDLVSGQTLVSNTHTRLLTYTPSKLYNYYKDKPYITIDAALQKTSDRYFASFIITFKSKDIQKSYGRIQQGNFLRIKMLNGKVIFLKALEDAAPTIEPITGNTIYNVRASFNDKSDIKLLGRLYADQLGILWSSGFEEYPIYEVSFFQSKLDCLNK